LFARNASFSYYFRQDGDFVTKVNNAVFNVETIAVILKTNKSGLIKNTADIRISRVLS